jgi:hypothetical protein
MKRTKLVCGIGFNDLDDATVVTEIVDGKEVRKPCPYYKKWQGMLARCYGASKKPCYDHSYVCEEWLIFSNFKAWMMEQDWEGKDLDKDLLVKGNKIYSPETCVFLHPKVNRFLTKNHRQNGLPAGVWDYVGKKTISYRARVHEPFEGKLVYLGSFKDKWAAHEAWINKKHFIACKLAFSEYVTDERVQKALLNRYINN